MTEGICLREVTLLLILLTAAYCDILSNMIPNILIAFSYLAAALLALVCPTPAECSSIILFILLLVLLLFLRGRGMIGGGDIKLFIAVMMFYPASYGLYIIALSMPVSLLISLRAERIPMAAGTFGAALILLLNSGGFK